MADIVFARPRHPGQSYTDLWRLIELNGYPLIYYDEIDPQSDNCYICTIANGDIEAGWQHPKARIILWDFEWRPDAYPAIPGLSARWHMDKWTADRHGVQYVPVGGDARLRPERIIVTAVVRIPIDVAYYGYIFGVQRREAILEHLNRLRIEVTPTGLWDVEPDGKVTNNRDYHLELSKLYLHVHQRADSPGVPGLRLVVAAAYGLPVISETFADAGIFQRAVMDIEYDQLVGACDVLLHDPNGKAVLDDLSQRLSHLLNEEHTFRKGIEAAV